MQNLMPLQFKTQSARPQQLQLQLQQQHEQQIRQQQWRGIKTFMSGQ